jgi:hypothetical protein
MTIWAIWDCYALLKESTHKFYLNTTYIDHGKWIGFYWKLMHTIVVTYEIRVFFEGAKKEVFSSIFKKTL